jgi:hypothetical protein
MAPEAAPVCCGCRECVAPGDHPSVAEQATAHPAVAPRGRFEQSLLDLSVRDAQLLRQGIEVDEMAQRILAQAHRSGLVSLQPEAEAAPGSAAEPHLVSEQLDADMAGIHASVYAADKVSGRAAERDATRAAEINEATAKEPAIQEFQAEPSLEPSWQQGEADRSPAAAAPEADASHAVREIRDEEPELEL